jgi:competence protein ComEC
MTPSKILFYFCLSFIIGIFFESVVKIPQFVLWVFLLLGFFSVFISFMGRGFGFLKIVGFCLFFIILGVLRMQISEFNIANDSLSALNDKGKITAEGIIIAEPDVRDTFQKIKVKVNGSTVLVTTKRYPEYNYLDKINLSGKLETPSVTDEFNYKNYLMKDHIYSVMNFPKIVLISEKHEYNILSFLYEKILSLKQKIRISIKSNFSPPQSSILEGTILGDNGAMSNELKNKLNITGLRHIIAVSGTHVVILSAIILSFLLFLGLSRGQAFYAAVIFVCFYIILTGLPPSGIRAGAMGGLYLLARKMGRQSMGLRVITMACAVMVFVNPLYLLYDVGFQLSFLAVLGLIYLDPLIKLFFKFGAKKIFNFDIKGKSGNLIGMISTTLAAQVFTLPIMIFNFGNISYVSPITNLLISPVVSFLMVFGFLASIAGVFSNILGYILSVPCYFLLNYFIWVINTFSQPWAMGIVQNVSWVWLLISYLVIVFLVRFLNKKFKKSFT